MDLRELLLDLVLPETDRGVVLQVLFVLPVLAAWIWFARHDRDQRLLAIGSFVFVASLFALRTLH